jgi:hypothetical protein
MLVLRATESQSRPFDPNGDSGYAGGVAGRILPDDPVAFIRDCLQAGQILWTYHVNMRLGERPITRQMVIDAGPQYEVVEAYPEDKYFPSYLVLGRTGGLAFHVLFGTDVAGRNVRVVTAYYPSPEEWEPDLKTRRRSP